MLNFEIINVCILTLFFFFFFLLATTSLDPDQDRQNVGPELNLNCLSCVPESFFGKK